MKKQHEDLSAVILVQLGIKGFLLICGLTTNLAAIVSMKPWKKLTSSYLLLKLHLCISDILLIVVYNSSVVVFFLNDTVGDSLAACKSMQFFVSLGFHLCSYITLAIAVDRVVVVCKPYDNYAPNNRTKKAFNRPKFLVCLAWIFAVLFSVPQLVFYELRPGGGSCCTIWEIQANEVCSKRLNSIIQTRRHSFNSTGANSTSGEVSWRYYSKFLYSCVLQESYSDVIYEVTRMFITFWLPVAVIFYCNVRLYTKLSTRTSLCSNERRAKNRTLHGMRRQARKATLRHIFTLTIFFAVCWLPYSIEALRQAIHRDRKNDVIMRFLIDIVIFWAVLNPLVYKKPAISKQVSR